MPRPPQHHASSGERGREAEDRAQRFLEARGLRLIARNYRTRWGEIDLVMEHAGQVVFIEVRARSNRRFGGAAASVTAAKQCRLIRAASQFLGHSRLAHRPVRFDIVAVDGTGATEWPMDWIRDAFRPPD